MSDEFFREIQADWQQQDTAFAAVHARLTRSRWQPHLVLAMELASAAVAMLVGLWFASTALRLHSLLFALSAAVLLLAVPPLALAAVLARKGSLRWEDETPEGVINAALRRADASLRSIRVGRWHVWIVATFVIVLWITEAMGLISAESFLIFYSSVCAAISVPYLLWLRRREHRVRKERAVCHRLLEDLRSVED